MRSEYHDELVKNIRDSIEWHVENDQCRKVRFFFSTSDIGEDSWGLCSDECSDIIETFRHIGIECDACDTVPGAFTANRDYNVAECDRCIMDYGYVLPVSDDFDALARMVEYEHSGKVQFIIYVLD